MNMARIMLKEKNLSNEYWAEAVACSVYILNPSPTSSVKDKVPQEAWSGMKSGVSHFRVFGCVAYAHIPEELRKKLDDRSEKCIFIGYSEQSKAYRLYNPVTKKFLVSRDVNFLEDKAWEDQLTGESSPQGPFPHRDTLAEPTAHQTQPRLPRLEVQTQGQDDIHGPFLSNNSNSTNSPKQSQKMRQLQNIYDQLNEEVNFTWSPLSQSILKKPSKKNIG